MSEFERTFLRMIEEASAPARDVAKMVEAHQRDIARLMEPIIQDAERLMKLVSPPRECNWARPPIRVLCSAQAMPDDLFETLDRPDKESPPPVRGPVGFLELSEQGQR